MGLSDVGRKMNNAVTNTMANAKNMVTDAVTSLDPTSDITSKLNDITNAASSNAKSFLSDITSDLDISGSAATAGGDEFSKISSILSDSVGLPPSVRHEIEDALNDREGPPPGLLSILTMGTMPIMALYPAYPTVGNAITEEGLQLYDISLADGLVKYKDILKSAGITNTIAGPCLYIAFLNDSSISESFGVEFGESKFEGISNFASNTLSELKFITGAETGFGGMEKIAKEMTKEGGLLGMAAGSLLGAAGKLGGALSNLAGKIGKTEYANILSGSKVDFPMIWTGANYSPSYSFTVRLYNPNPKNEKSYNEFIVEPLAKILAFTIPIADSGSTFSYPVLCKVVCPGMFQIDGGYISSVDIIKGGETNDFSFSQQPGTVDVKITINELYNTMVAQVAGAAGDKNRPTFLKYINNIKKKVGIEELTWVNAISGGNFFEASGSSLQFAKFNPIEPDVSAVDRSEQDRVSSVMSNITSAISAASSLPSDDTPNIPSGLIDTLMSTNKSISGRVKSISESIRSEVGQISTPIANAYSAAKNVQSTAYGQVSAVQNDINNLIALKEEARREMSRAQGEITT